MFCGYLFNNYVLSLCDNIHICYRIFFLIKVMLEATGKLHPVPYIVCFIYNSDSYYNW